MNTDYLKLSRVDFRLIHGQVMTRWVKEKNIESIIVVDEKSATNTILKKILLSAAPSHIEVLIKTSDEVVHDWKNQQMPEKNYMLLFKDINTVISVWKKGLDIKDIQIGGVEGTIDRKAIARNVLLSQKDVEQLKVLHDKEVNIFCQAIPDDPLVTFNSVLEKF